MSNTLRWIAARFLRIAADHLAAPKHQRPKLTTPDTAPGKLLSILHAYGTARESATLSGQPPSRTEDWIAMDSGVIALCQYASALEAAARRVASGETTDGIIALRAALAALDLDPGIRATPLWDPTRTFPWLKDRPPARLCFVRGSFAYFTDCPLDKIPGVGWDDSNPMHYAKPPPAWTEACGLPRYRIVLVAFDGPWIAPWECHTEDYPPARRLSVAQLNAGHAPWLRSPTREIHAGATIEAFADQIRAGGGSVYMATHHTAGPFQ